MVRLARRAQDCERKAVEQRIAGLLREVPYVYGVYRLTPLLGAHLVATYSAYCHVVWSRCRTRAT